MWVLDLIPISSSSFAQSNKHKPLSLKNKKLHANTMTKPFNLALLLWLSQVRFLNSPFPIASCQPCRNLLLDRCNLNIHASLIYFKTNLLSLLAYKRLNFVCWFSVVPSVCCFSPTESNMSSFVGVLVSDQWLQSQFTQVELRTLKSKVCFFLPLFWCFFSSTPQSRTQNTHCVCLLRSF